MLVDSAGWRTAKDRRVPPYITLGHLPPCSPDLNAIEKVWRYFRDRYLSEPLFAGTHAIGDACCDAWNSLIADAGRIRSLTDFDLTKQVNQSCDWYQSRAFSRARLFRALGGRL